MTRTALAKGRSDVDQCPQTGHRRSPSWLSTSPARSAADSTELLASRDGALRCVRALARWTLTYVSPDVRCRQRRLGDEIIDPRHDREQPDAILANWYRYHYNTIAATADGSFFHRFMHQAMERPYVGKSFSSVLEVGGNRGEHVPFVQHFFNDYTLTDLAPPEVGEELLKDPRVRTEVADVTALEYPDETFERVISTCVMHHVSSPLTAASEMRRVTRPGGVVTILVPTDPGLAYRLGRAATSGRNARRAGLAEDLKLVSALDHSNHFRSIRAQLQHAFRHDEVMLNWRPFRVPSVELNAFVVVHVRRSDRAAS